MHGISQINIAMFNFSYSPKKTKFVNETYLDTISNFNLNNYILKHIS